MQNREDVTLDKVRSDTEQFFKRSIDLLVGICDSIEDYSSYLTPQSMIEPYHDKQGRGWYTSADKQKYKHKHKRRRR